MDDTASSDFQVEQTEVPKVLLLGKEDLPEGFVYPPEFLFLVDSRMVFFPPWQLLFDRWTKVSYDGLRERYPTRVLVPFARRFNTDDVACWENGNNREVVVVHDHASKGWEDRGERYPDFWSWYRATVEEMIEFELDDR
jgi:hypothetical protein